MTQISLTKADKKRTLEATGHWPDTHHIFDRRDLLAVNLALAAGRPLLLRGDPGCGKSQLARAAAHALGWPFLCKVVNARSEPEDLLYRFDAVARLAQAQILPRDPGSMAQLSAANFLIPEVLWWAFDHGEARRRLAQAARCCGDLGCDYGLGLLHPFAEDKGCVVLIDEIDKADSEVPNSLLEVFSLGGFSLPYGGGSVTTTNCLRPLVIVTTNEDRELPPAFLRRCLVHQMDRGEDELPKFLEERVRAHHPDTDKLSGGVIATAIKQLMSDRRALASSELAKPGLAELLDLLSGLVGQGLGANETKVADFAAFAFNKHREL